MSSVGKSLCVICRI